MVRDHDGRHFRTIQRNCFDPRARIDDLDRRLAPLIARLRAEHPPAAAQRARSNLESAAARHLPVSPWQQVLSTVPVMFSYWARPSDALDLSRLLNDHIAQVCRDHPAHFLGLGTVPLQDPDLACRELERCIRDLGLRGIQIGTHVEANPFVNGGSGRKHDWNLSEPALFPVFQTAADLGAAVFVHPWDMMGAEQMERYWLPWLVGMPAETARAICSVIFGGVLERLPDLRICFAHGGGSFPATIGRIAHGFKARPDLVAVDNPVDPRHYLAHPLPDADPAPHPAPAESVESARSTGRQATRRTRAQRRPARFFVDSLTHDTNALRLLLRLFGAERIALGSDYPFPLGEDVPGAMIADMPDLDAETRHQMLSVTALQFLGH
jgi:aminocarboxymuconate-semialdehyde decarboxylase